MGVDEVPRSCPICTSTEVSATRERIATRVATFRMWRCSDCRSDFAMPRLAVLGEYYDYEKPTVRWEFEEVCQFLVSRGIRENVLDLGCGNGAFVAHLLQAGILAEGIDINEMDIHEAQRRGLPCSAGDLCDLPEERCFAVITAFHVLEHVEAPSKLMEAVRERLIPGGRFLVSIPNVERFHLRFRRDDGDYPPHHLSRISHAGMMMLARRSGMDVEWWRVEPYSASWKNDTSMTANRMLDALGIRVAVKSRPWLNYPVKLVCYTAAQPYVWFWRAWPGKRQGYTALYCMRRRR